MDFRGAITRVAGSLSGDFEMSADPIGGVGDEVGSDLRTTQPDPKSDDTDPAAPGGASPYNGAPPFGEPVATDPEWRDPQDGPRSSGPVPFHPGPNVDTTTIHNARRDSYYTKINRERDVR